MTLSALEVHGQGMTFPGILCSETDQYMLVLIRQNIGIRTAGIHAITSRLHSFETTTTEKKESEGLDLEEEGKETAGL